MYFLHQIKRTNNVYDKGIVVKETYEGAKQGYHSYLGAYAYGQNPQTDFVSVMISDERGTVLMNECWNSIPETPAS